MNLTSLKSSRAARFLVLAVMVVSAVGMVVGPMLGGRSAQGDAKHLSAKERAALEQLAASLQQKLNAVQERALRANPTLEEKQRSVMALIDQKMRATGTDPTRVEQSIKELQSRVEDRELSEPQRKKAAADALAQLRSFRRARTAALQDSSVATPLRSFKDELLMAMKKLDPSVGGLIQELEETEAQLAEQPSPGRS